MVILNSSYAFQFKYKHTFPIIQIPVITLKKRRKEDVIFLFFQIKVMRQKKNALAISWIFIKKINFKLPGVICFIIWHLARNLPSFPRDMNILHKLMKDAGRSIRKTVKGKILNFFLLIDYHSVPLKEETIDSQNKVIEIDKYVFTRVGNMFHFLF